MNTKCMRDDKKFCKYSRNQRKCAYFPVLHHVPVDEHNNANDGNIVVRIAVNKSSECKKFNNLRTRYMHMI